MSRLPLRGRLKAVAAGFWQLSNSPSTRKDFLAPAFLMNPIPPGLAGRACMPFACFFPERENRATRSAADRLADGSQNLPRHQSQH